MEGNKHVIRLIKAFLSISLSASNFLYAQEAPESQMLRLMTTIYKVEELEKAKNWYSTAFEIAPYFDEPYYVGLSIRGFELGLVTDSQPKKGENVIAY